MKTFFDWEPTPDPKEFCFWVIVGVEDFDPNPGVLVDGVTTYGSLKLRVQGIGSQLDGYSDWVYVQSDKPATGFMRLWFCKPKTDAQKEQPFSRWKKVDEFTWDMILLGIGVKPIHGFPQSTYAVVNGAKTLVSATRFRGVEIYIPRTTTPTEFEVEEFLSPTPFKISRWAAPIPMPVDYEVLGIKREFPACLHGDLFLNGVSTGIQMLTGTTGAAVTGAIEGYKFPATNFTSWQSHYVHDDQQRLNGMWYRTRIRAIAPRLPMPVHQSG